LLVDSTDAAQDAEIAVEAAPPLAKPRDGAGAPLLARTIGDLPEGVAIFDAAGRLVACNAPYRGLNPEIAAELAVGASYAALLRMQITRLGAESDPEAAIAAALAQHKDLPWRQEYRRADGVWVRVVESRTNDGGTLRLMSDISAVKNREMKLAELAERNAVLATAVASVTSGIVICDATRPDLPIAFVNAAFTRITGYAAGEVLGRNCRFLQGRDTDKETVERIRRGLAQGRPVSATIRNYRKDGKTFWNELNISPLFDADGHVISWVGILQDATSRMRTEDNLREAKNQAEIANRTKTEFLANMSHELRTPLNAILGFSEVMKMEFFGPIGAPQYRQYAEDVHVSGTLLLQLINDVLDISKIEAGKMELYPEAVPVEELIQSSARLMRDRAAAGGVSLVPAVEPGLRPLYVDRRAIKQMVNNLLSNAIKFTPKDGSVTISAKAGENGRIDIACADTGVGIAAANIDKVLSPFGQVDNPLSRRHQGTGLGLPIVKNLVELSGGAFFLVSEIGKGTTVTLRLPATEAVVGAGTETGTPATGERAAQ
jgi:PAS domain S-box-containing protein